MIPTTLISQYIKELKFPVQKQDILIQARIRNAPAKVMNILNDLLDQKYTTSLDLWHGINMINRIS